MDLYGVKFSIVNPNNALKAITGYSNNKPGYVCFPSTNIVAKARKDKTFQSILNNAYLTVPDGQVTQMYAKLKGIDELKTTSGFWLLKKLLETELTHYFYGTDIETLSKIKEKIKSEFPNANVLGYKPPPIISIDDIADNKTIEDDMRKINAMSPDLIWIGLTNIKQDYLMSQYLNKLDKGLMLGVGAVFLYFAGKVKMGPVWMKKLGIRWIYRIIQEPRRQMKNTVPSVLQFIWLFFKFDILKIKQR